MISELKLGLSRDATNRHKPEYVRLTLAAMQTAIVFPERRELRAVVMVVFP